MWASALLLFEVNPTVTLIWAEAQLSTLLSAAAVQWPISWACFGASAEMTGICSMWYHLLVG